MNGDFDRCLANMNHNSNPSRKASRRTCTCSSRLTGCDPQNSPVTISVDPETPITGLPASALALKYK